MATEKTVRTLALALPETNEKPCYGTPGFYVKSKLFARLLPDGRTLAVRVDPGEREAMLAAVPEVFFVTPHYRAWPMVLIRLPRIERADLAERLLEAWRLMAPAKLLAEQEARVRRDPRPMEGRHVLVTGASGAIGGAIAELLGDRGARVLAVGRDSARLDALARRLRGRERAASVLAVDLVDDGAIERVAAAALTEFAGVDVLVHAAGSFASGPLETQPAEVLDQQLRINLRVPYLLTQRLLPALCERRGEIVFVNSSVVQSPRAGVGAYAASKAALRALADSLRAEVNARGVRVLSVFPGRTASAMQEQVHQREGKAYRAETLLQPEDVASAVANALALPRTAEVTDVYVRPMQAS